MGTRMSHGVEGEEWKLQRNKTWNKGGESK